MIMADVRTIDVVFDRSTVYRLQSDRNNSPNVIAHILEDFVHRKPEADHNLGTQNHPISGYEEKTETRVYHATLEAYNSPKQMAPLPPINVAVKWAKGKRAVANILYEAALYDYQLRPLQGKVVPRFYGYFEANADEVNIACLVLEWCGEHIDISEEEMNRRRMTAIYKLHEQGIEHGDLFDGHHFVPAIDQVLRVVDFSKAHMHHCEDVVVRQPYDLSEVLLGCRD